jgi:hypothetical protein
MLDVDDVRAFTQSEEDSLQETSTGIPFQIFLQVIE